ncbi:MAG TPA: FliM/FliN family flagellar motor C-terminal domain-containing protein [Bryobacteraceae bacterium]|nr:FliM/FliN family flagellar motor C-terminal domain-containing protein [Bryobacteraceae bacterium]
MNPAQETLPIAALGDIKVPVVAELDNMKLTTAQIMELKIGQVIALSRPAGENITIYLGHVLLGWGEILVSDGSLAVRISTMRDAVEEEQES